jgi:hypothetical protein
MIYSNGVEVRTGRVFDSDYRVIRVPATSIKSATLWKGMPAAQVANIIGDVVFNFSPFSTTNYAPNLGLKINTLIYHAYVDFNPWIAWSSNKLVINHTKSGGFNTMATVAQGFRYIMQNGVKNPNSNADWNPLEPRRLIATNAAGDTIIISVKGRSTTNAGISLHQAYDLAVSLNLGIITMLDGDSGSSVQDYIRVDSTPDIFRGVESINQVPVYGVINLNLPTMSDGATEPPPPPPTVSWPDKLVAFSGSEYKEYFPK